MFSEIIESFKTRQQQGNLHPCWLITGDLYLKKDEFVKILAKELLYKNPKQEHGMPNSLIDKQIAMNCYPNYLFVSAPLNDDGTPGREINAETAKAIKLFLQKKSAVLGWRTIIVDSVDIMNRFAANSLLKMLEEPPSQTLILLLCHRPGYVLPTIRSRCQILHLKGVINLPENLKNLGTMFTQALKNCLSGKNIDAFKEYVLTHDKNLKNFFYVVLDELHQCLSSGTLVPEHATAAYEAVHTFFLSTDQAHLDPKHVISATFMLIKNPEALAA